ncbi:hypothetical protein K2173_005499 [Erythroxylum novogranatense]|uniref:phosphoribosylformylglycinamidine cyclo-ligase n=1 Tax=Erythroxylum novogranatense TaxID=1862640 RepID=A0AAV8SL35_9ROSI|nr:hypothetical protein K2173_005499 [Erythroxylum novogranatense]
MPKYCVFLEHLRHPLTLRINPTPPLGIAFGDIQSIPNSTFSLFVRWLLWENVESGSNRDVGLTYKKAGVDIDAGSELIRWIAKMAPGIGGFGGLYPLDGVGTKLKLAFETGIHETIGIDLVAMSVNDIVTSGAKPLFFLDYFAMSRLDIDLAEKLALLMVANSLNYFLLGREIGEYDLSGFAVGIVRRDSVIDGKSIVARDVLIDLLLGESVTLGKALMAPTVIYVKQVLDLINKEGVKGTTHITGGGFTDNIPRVFRKGLAAAIYTNSWEVPAIFRWIQQAGRMKDAEIRRTFNMGIGMVLVVSREASDRILAEDGHKYKAYRIGEVVSGEGVTY